MRYRKLFIGVFLLMPLMPTLVFGTVTGGITPSQIEADWLKQAEASWKSAPKLLSTQFDSAGAVDGIKNGKYGFHTGLVSNPWWQIDLEQPTPISRMVVYNRLDYAPGLHLADTMQILVSDDAQTWTKIYDCDGKHFGGIHGEKPLELSFEPGKLTTRFIRLQIPGNEPVFFHLDEVEIFSSDNPIENIALWKPTDQCSLSPWSTVKAKPVPETEKHFPVEEVRARLRHLAGYLKDRGIDVSTIEQQMDGPVNPDEKEEYLRLRRLGRQLVFRNPLLDFDRLLFVKRFTQQTYPDICLNHMPWVSQPGGDIFILEKPFVPDGMGQTVKPILQDRLGPGHVRGIDLHWDGNRIVFGYARQGNFPFNPWPPSFGSERDIGHKLRLSQTPIHIYEVGVNGDGLRQITNHDMWSDLDPAYLPNDDIVFVSERCGFSLQCNNGPHHDETSCNLYTVSPDGSNLRWLSYNKDGDYQPHVFNDGTIGYCRWEYQERGWATIQSVWYIRPDGTGADALFKQHLDNPWAFENTREIPTDGTEGRKFVSIAAGHHTLACGPVCILIPNQGINSSDSIKIVTPGVHPPEGGMSGSPVDEGGCRENGGYYMYPWPLSDKFFLASYTYTNDHPPGTPDCFRGTDETGYGIYLIDVFGNKELIYSDPEISSSFPMPLRPRQRPPVISGNCETTLGNRAICSVADVAYGVKDVKREEIKYVRIAHKVGWPYTRESGGQRYEVDGSSWGLSWAPVTVFGEVPVEADGSASFEVPADVSLYFQLLDADKREIKRMRSFISFQPGEQRSCIGCHETREVAPIPTQNMAMNCEPSVPAPPPWGSDRCLNYLADVQPVFDRHCVSCHSGLKPAAGLDFSGGLTAAAPMKTPYRTLNFDGLNRSYRTIIENDLITFSDKHAPASELTQTRQFGSTRSRLIDAIMKGSCSTLKPGDEDWYRLVTWIDANAPYHDRFVNSRPRELPYDLPADKDLLNSVKEIHHKRCAECHQADDVSRLDWIDLRNPERSLFLAAPLSREAGGAQRCNTAIYADRNDPDYGSLRKMVNDAVDRAWKFPRRDLETLRGQLCE